MPTAQGLVVGDERVVLIGVLRVVAEANEGAFGDLRDEARGFRVRESDGAEAAAKSRRVG